MTEFNSVFRADLLDGKVILVTGGGTGIGRCIAHELSSLGAHVVVAGRRPEPLDETVSEIEAAGGKASAMTLTRFDTPISPAPISRSDKSISANIESKSCWLISFPSDPQFFSRRMISMTTKLSESNRPSTESCTPNCW